MAILSCQYYGNLKRYWRRRKYQQRINGSKAHHSCKRKLKIIRLGEAASASAPRWIWRIRRTPKLLLKIVSPVKLLVQFHDAYVDMMIRLTNKVANPNRINGGLLSRGKKFAKSRQVLTVPYGELEVDSRLVEEICKKLAASPQFN